LTITYTEGGESYERNKKNKKEPHLLGGYYKKTSTSSPGPFALNIKIKIAKRQEALGTRLMRDGLKC